MKPETLDTLLTRWRAALPVRYAPAYIDGFLRRHRDLIVETSPGHQARATHPKPLTERRTSS